MPCVIWNAGPPAAWSHRFSLKDQRAIPRWSPCTQRSGPAARPARCGSLVGSMKYSLQGSSWPAIAIMGVDLPADPRIHDEHCIGLKGHDDPQEETAHRQLDLAQLDDLVCVVESCVGTLSLLTGAGLGIDFDDLRGATSAWRCPGLPCPPERAVGCSYGGSAERGQSTWRERCCKRTSSAMIRTAYCWMTASSWMTHGHTTSGLCAPLAASSASPTGS